MAQTMEYPNRPANAILSIHKKGWSKSINGTCRRIAGKIPYHLAVQKYYERMVKIGAATAQPEVSVAVSVVAPVVPAAPVVVPVVQNTLTIEQLRDKFLAFKYRENVAGTMKDRSYQTLADFLRRYADSGVARFLTGFWLYCGATQSL